MENVNSIKSVLIWMNSGSSVTGYEIMTTTQQLLCIISVIQLVMYEDCQNKSTYSNFSGCAEICSGTYPTSPHQPLMSKAAVFIF